MNPTNNGHFMGKYFDETNHEKYNIFDNNKEPFARTLGSLLLISFDEGPHFEMYWITG